MARADVLVKRARRELQREGVTSHGGINIGFLLLFIGVVWLAIEQGWLPQEWPIWPVILIVAGLFLWISRPRKH